MTTPTDLIVYHAARIVTQLRACGCAGLGKDLCTSELLASVRAVDRVSVKECPALTEKPFEWGMDTKGGYVIRVRAGISPDLRAYAQLLFAATRGAGEIPYLMDTAHVVALYAYVPARVISGPGGPEAAARLLTQLLPIGTDWCLLQLVPLLTLVAKVRLALDDSDGRHDAADVEITAMRAYEEGQAQRKKGTAASLNEALHWFGRAWEIGRRNGDCKTAALARMAAGKVALLRREDACAERYFSEALQVAEYGGCMEEVGMANHDLMLIYARRGDSHEVRRAARSAMAAYGPGCPKLVPLAADVAVFWQDQRQFAAAMVVHHALIQNSQCAGILRANTVGNIATCAAATEQRHLYEARWMEAWGLFCAEDPEPALYGFQGLLYAAQLVGDDLRAGLAAKKCEELANFAGCLYPYGRRVSVAAADGHATRAYNLDEDLAAEFATALVDRYMTRGDSQGAIPA